jgi:hypothetical protein
MMRIPNCPDHGRLVLNLAQGRLDDRDAAEAEAVRTSCPACAEWWSEQFDGEPAASIDAAVERAFSDVRPSRRRLPAWLPAAAAAVLVAGAAALWYAGDRVTAQRPRHEAVVQEGFDSDLNGDGTVDTSDIGFTVHVEGSPSEAPSGSTGEVIFADSLDGGELSGWTSST